MWSKVLMLLSTVLFIMACSGGDQGQHEIVTGPTAQSASNGSAITAEQLEEIQSVERVGRSAIIECYTEELERRQTKKLVGDVTVRILIGTTGRANQVTITESTLKAPEVHECIKQVIMRWDFPALAAASWYGTTFSFSPAY